jgi:flagellar hook-associated protein 2
MATISSLGIGSGLDSNSIVSKLVALEKQPLVQLKAKADLENSQISAFGKVQGEFSALSDAASAMVSASAWSARNASSSNSAAATITVDSTAQATSFSVDVDQLAVAQSNASAGITTSSAVGAGVLKIQLGTWTGTGTKTFAAGSASAISVSVSSTDTVTTLAAKINKANTGVVATAFNDGTQDRLLLRSKDTGTATGFQVLARDVTDTTTVTDGTGLSRFAFDPGNTIDPAYGMASASAGTPQYGVDAKARINGLAITSASNTLSSNIPGVTINLLATTTTNYGSVSPAETTSPITMRVSEDVTPAVKSVQAFVTAYNTLMSDLTTLTKYEASTKTPGLFQGDASVVGLQRVLRSITSSISKGSSAYSYLNDVGIEQQLDGTLAINTTKLAAAANNGTQLQNLFTTDNGNKQTNGFALKFRDLASGAVAAGGSVANKAAALQKALASNSADQDKINARADAVQTRLVAQYSALDGKMASLNALSSYVSQQVTTWNKSTA